MEYTKEIETPISGHKVVIKTMITGAEREQIDTAEMNFIKTENGSEFKVTDIKKVENAKKHELLRVSVVSINEDTTDCFDRAQKMYEADYNFVYEQILENQKKMMPSTSVTS